MFGLVSFQSVKTYLLTVKSLIHKNLFSGEKKGVCVCVGGGGVDRFYVTNCSNPRGKVRTACV